MEKKRKILAVDDDIHILKLLRLKLEKQGFDVIVGTDGNEAISLYDQHKPDLILMDLTMPGKNGLDACQIIKKRDPSRFIPIIFLTGKGSTEDKMKGFDIGADDYLTKPVEVKELIARIRSLLRIKQLTEELQKTQKELIEAKQVAAVAAAAVTVNHKINSPLTHIMINTEILDSKIPDASRKQCRPYLESISDAAKKISHLTKKLAELSKPNFTDYLAGTAMLDIDLEEIK